MRIISGRFGGRDLGGVPDGVRPTSDRVRESLFSVLGSVEDFVVLDLFAGTGALGLEAYSRGADVVYFVEKSRRVARDLDRRFSVLDLEDSGDLHLLICDAIKALSRFAKEDGPRFDLVFLDPPYEKGDRMGTLNALFSAGILADGAKVVVEGPKRHPLASIAGARVVDERDYGDTKLTWLEKSRRVEG